METHYAMVSDRPSKRPSGPPGARGLAKEVLVALGLPDTAHVAQRVPKKMLIENGAPTPADKRKINDGIEEMLWLAALKPTTVGIPALRHETREYLEIAVLSVVMREDAQVDRLTALIHRAIPYPVLLLASQGDALTISLAHKRGSESEAGAVVVDGAIVAAALPSEQSASTRSAFLHALAIVRQPRADLFALYDGWMDTVVALLAAQVTGTFATAPSREQASARRAALEEYERLDAQMTTLRSAAAKERQLSRQVELNLELQRLQAEHSAVRAKL
jgi:Domain of unknown function (DUF4391)